VSRLNCDFRDASQASRRRRRPDANVVAAAPPLAGGAWTDAELLVLGDELFPEGGTCYVAPAIRDLFVSGTGEEG
jgi:hypothetical protein